MKNSIKNKIFQFLKTNKPKQCKKFLRTDDAFCFLGLICYIHSMETNNSWNSTNGISEYLGRQAFIPISVMKWAGLSIEDSKKIAKLNDEGLTFNKILRSI